jgi:hypothetical protein
LLRPREFARLFGNYAAQRLEAKRFCLGEHLEHGPIKWSLVIGVYFNQTYFSTSIITGFRVRISSYAMTFLSGEVANSTYGNRSPLSMACSLHQAAHSSTTTMAKMLQLDSSTESARGRQSICAKALG